jgi:hypothetical protein
MLNKPNNQTTKLECVHKKNNIKFVVICSLYCREKSIINYFDLMLNLKKMWSILKYTKYSFVILCERAKI